jgi:hypothetical protein
MTPEAKQIMQFAEKKVRELRDADPKISGEQLQQRVAIAVSDYAGKTVGQARLERVMGSLPALAKNANNPIGKLSGDAWSRVRANASASAYAGIANQLGVKPDEVRRMRTTGKPLDSTPASKELFDKFVAMAPQFNSLEHQALVAELDELPQLVPGVRNSDHLISFMNSREFNDQANAYESNTSAASFGDYLVDPMSKGSLGKMAGMEAAGLEAAQADRAQADRQMARQIASGYSRNPAVRVSAILTGIPGVGKEGANKLVPLIRDFIKQNDAKFFTGMGDRSYSSIDTLPWNETTRLQNEDTIIFNYLTTTKFEDPSLEAWRKAAVKGWKDSQDKSYSYMETLWNSTFTWQGSE